MRSIRLRVAVGVFGVVMTLVALQNLYALNRFERGFRADLDDELRDELAEVREQLGSPDLGAWIDSAVRLHSRAGELFIEIRGADGEVAARSANVPAEGFPGAQPLAPGASPRIFEVVHPRSRSGARRIRAVEVRDGPWQVRIAFGLDQVQRWYWNLRSNLLTSLLLIASLGTLLAWWVAARALRPLSEIAARARSLGALPDGVLPRTGSGDEVDRLAGVLNDLLVRIREEVLRVRRLTADVGHALRTPLTAIRGALELHLVRTHGADEDVLGGVVEQVDELTRLVNKVLLLEKLESGRVDPENRERVDLLALTRALVDHLRVLGEEREIAIEVSGEPVPVEIDPGQIRQALVNLVDNALRHTPRGGRISIAVGRNEDRARVTVADTGPGIPPGELERVFERFYSSAEGNGGTGLGLPIARAIARAHGGSLTASSPGGATFELELPLAGQTSH